MSRQMNIVFMLLGNDNSETTAIYKSAQIKNIFNSHELSSRRMNSVPVKSIHQSFTCIWK